MMAVRNKQRERTTREINERKEQMGSWEEKMARAELCPSYLRPPAPESTMSKS